MYINDRLMSQNNVTTFDADGDTAMDELGGAGNSNSTRQRGQKRPHQNGCAGNGYPCECEMHSNDDVDLPLSKRICRLHLEHENGQNRISPDPQPKNEQDEAEKRDSFESQNEFSSNYPYDVSSPYYVNNELLYKLHLERTRRQQLQQEPPQP